MAVESVKEQKAQLRKEIRKRLQELEPETIQQQCQDILA